VDNVQCASIKNPGQLGKGTSHWLMITGMIWDNASVGVLALPEKKSFSSFGVELGPMEHSAIAAPV
jgi:hypothetical protein